MIKDRTIKDFVRESNRIEGIERDLDRLTDNQQFEVEVEAHRYFVRLPQPTVINLQAFVTRVTALQAHPGVLRTSPAMGVSVGGHVAPPGGPEIVERLKMILFNVIHRKQAAHETHVAYETLHPFTDGNGRSGRVLWLWQMGGIAPLGFLHKFYYQTLQASK